MKRIILSKEEIDLLIKLLEKNIDKLDINILHLIYTKLLVKQNEIKL